MQQIYLDHNATTPLHPDVLAAMLPYLREARTIRISLGRDTTEAEVDTAAAALAEVVSKLQGDAR